MPRLSNVDDLLFPVEEHPVFALVRSADGDRRLPIPGRKAIVNSASQRVLGVVGRDYAVVSNRQALDWARQCCATVFPDTSATEWQVHSADAPATASYCYIDLVHNSGAVDFSLVPANQRPDAFGPFIRVTNSYNLLRALVFDIGLHRKVCRNGLILPQKLVQFRFSHDRRSLRKIQFDVERSQLAKLTETFRASVTCLADYQVPADLFENLVQGVLGVRPPENPENLTADALGSFKELKADLRTRTTQYVSELGLTAYSVFNVVTDVASRPPENAWIRRDRHSLQRRIGAWLPRFTAECQMRDFSLAHHIETLRPTKEIESGRSLRASQGASAGAASV